jgi:hypothetical protein
MVSLLLANSRLYSAPVVLMLVFRSERQVKDNQTRNIVLISLLVIYNINGGLLPDPNLPGSLRL